LQSNGKLAVSGISLGRPFTPVPKGSGLLGLSSEALQAFRDTNPAPHNPKLFSYRNPSFNLLRAALNR
jgi:hypothetical protein